MSATIHSICVRPQHRGSPASERTLTVHEGEWAYCPDGAGDDHDWKAIAPITLDELMIEMRIGERAPLGAA